LSRGFNLLWFGQAVSQLGDYIAYLTIPLFIQTLVDSTVQFGIAYALETFPTLLFGFFGGVLIDRVRRRSVMITADVVRAGAFFFLAYVAGRPDAGIAVVYVISFLVGTFATAFSNAMYAFIPSLVDGSQLAAANSRIAASQQVATAMGPLLAGAMAQSLGAGPGFFLNGATFLVSAASILFIGSSVEAAPAPRRNIFTEAKEGLAFLWNEARLRWSTIAAAVANFVVGFIESTLVVLATVVLGTQTEGQIGFLFSLMGVGGIAGALIAPRISAIFGLGRAMTIGFFIKGLSLLLLVNSRFGLAAFVAMRDSPRSHHGSSWRWQRCCCSRPFGQLSHHDDRARRVGRRRLSTPLTPLTSLTPTESAHCLHTKYQSFSARAVASYSTDNSSSGVERTMRRQNVFVEIARGLRCSE
jgi:MFS family permease